MFISSNFVFSQSQPFQVIVADKGYLFGNELNTLQYVDDVSTIAIKDGGYVALLHVTGNTFELYEETFTFYLKPHDGRRWNKLPELSWLLEDTTVSSVNKTIEVVYPPFDDSGYLESNANEPIEIFWHANDDQPVLNYQIAVSDAKGNKIQDFRTNKNSFLLNHATYGLQDPSFIFQVSSTFAGETIASKRYQVDLYNAEIYEEITSDLVMKALLLELMPEYAFEIWKKIAGSENGKYYTHYYQKFLIRNKEKLISAGIDVEQHLSQNK